MKTYRVKTIGTYIANYVVEASSVEDAIQQFKKWIMTKILSQNTKTMNELLALLMSLE